MNRPLPIASMISDEATFETYATTTGYVRLIMRPHGVERCDEREVAWDLTANEVIGLRTLLLETLPDLDEVAS